MGYRRVPFQLDEWFHCYNRGIDKRTVFETERDAERFLMLLYLANSDSDIHLADSPQSLSAALLRKRAKPLVAIGAYCLMKNHYHLLMKETTQNGITRFMQKLGTAYTMYFNTAHERTGNLFLKPFRSRHIHTDRYFQHVVNYIHLNAVELIEPGWKRGAVRSVLTLEKQLRAYKYSSLPDYWGVRRDLSAILSRDAFEIFHNQRPRTMLEEARRYYRELARDDADFA